MKAREIVTFLNPEAKPVLEPEERPTTVDRVIYGDPNQEVRAMATCWMPYSETLREAYRIGANVVVVHEPTFFAHLDLFDKKYAQLPATLEKKKLIDELGLTIIRCHDAWDWGIEKIGTLDSWSAFLGLNNPTGASDRNHKVYEVPEQSALDFAQYVAQKVKPLGQTCLRFNGDPDRVVRKVGLGVGSLANPFAPHELGADLAVTADDDQLTRAWIGGEWCRDTGFPLVVVNHGITEEPGVAAMAQHLSKQYPEIPVTHLQQGCSYREIMPK